MRHYLLNSILVLILSAPAVMPADAATLNCIAERSALAKATRYVFDPDASRDTPADADGDTVEIRTDAAIGNAIGEVAMAGQVVYLPRSDGKTSASEQRARNELLLRSLDARMQAKHGRRCPALFPTSK